MSRPGSAGPGAGTRFVCVHGHFYQPPRENPWLDIIEREPGAEPFPNWNARIAEECNEWNECDEYQSVYGNLVFVIEYDSSAFNSGCNNFPELSIVLRDVSVSPNGVYDAC